MTLSEALSAEVERQGISLNELSARSGVRYSRVHAVLRGDTPDPQLSTVRAVLAGLGKSLAWLERKLDAGGD